MDLSVYTRHVLVAVGLLFGFVLAALLLRQVATVLLSIFAGILLAVFLDAVAGQLARYTELPREWALALTVLLIVLLFAGAVWYAGPRVGDQFGRLTERIPVAMDDIRSSLSQSTWGRSLLNGFPSSQKMVSYVTGGLTNAAGAITSGIVLIVIGLYLAATPTIYIRGTLRLVPPEMRDRGRDIIRILGHALRWWLVGRIASMTVVGILTALGLWIVGVPLAFVLGLIAALLSFVPYVGPLVSVIPAILVALAENTTLVLYVLAVYAIVQFVESNIVTPLIQERTVSIPPALLISAQVVMGFLAGAVGVVIATPLAVVLIVLIQMLYIEDVLGEPVTPLGE